MSGYGDNHWSMSKLPGAVPGNSPSVSGGVCAPPYPYWKGVCLNLVKMTTVALVYKGNGADIARRH